MCVAGGKRKGRELATFTAAREVEEETHRVVTANRTLPMLSYAQCHYIAHCRQVGREEVACCLPLESTGGEVWHGQDELHSKAMHRITTLHVAGKKLGGSCGVLFGTRGVGLCALLSRTIQGWQ